jgi:hypothetical protein
MSAHMPLPYLIILIFAAAIAVFGLMLNRWRTVTIKQINIDARYFGEQLNSLINQQNYLLERFEQGHAFNIKLFDTLAHDIQQVKTALRDDEKVDCTPKTRPVAKATSPAGGTLTVAEGEGTCPDEATAVSSSWRSYARW